MESSPENRVVSVILAGGRGTRMRNDSKHKVCFEVGGIPIILRALANYQACGINHHIIVVGALGEQVLHTVGARMPNVSFAYQPEPRGTGNAARCGVRMPKSASKMAPVTLPSSCTSFTSACLKRIWLPASSMEACSTSLRVGGS